ncbi:MAG: class I SAM-dependent methyltransferase [Bacillota bacterium]
MQKRILKSLLNKLKGGNYKVIFWDEEEITSGSAPYKIEIIFNEPLLLGKLIADPVLAFGEAYMKQKIEIKGNLEELLRLRNQALNKLWINNFISRLSDFSRGVQDKIIGSQDKEKIQHHYDIGNEFFSLWLDKTMTYSCAYFNSPQDSLYQAQLQKIDHVLNKLQLQSGEKLLDIGSGWGCLIIRAVQKYDVNAVGLTLSEEQYQKTKQIIKDFELEEQVEVKLMDYKDMSPHKYQFDKIVSVGMFEHIGKKNYPVYMKKVHDLLKSGGLSLLHTITTLKEGPTNSWIGEYIFPGGYIPAVRQIVSLLPEYNFDLLHAENLRRHYALTLEQWHQNFCQEIDEIEQMFDKEFVRMWNLFLRGCAAEFRVGSLTIHQFLFSKGVNNQLPLTNKYIYEKK